MQKALSIDESRDLTRLEGVVDKGLANFIAVGAALIEIRDRKLHRNSAKSFDVYIQERFKLGKSHAYRLMEASQLVKQLGDSSPIGEGLNEHQVRKASDEAKERSQANGTSKADEFKAILLRRKEERDNAHEAAKRDRGSFERPEKDRVAAIRAKLYGAMKLIDGSLDCADELEDAIRKALEILDGAAIGLAA